MDKMLGVSVDTREELEAKIEDKLKKLYPGENAYDPHMMVIIAAHLADMFVPIGYYGRGEISDKKSDRHHTKVWTVFK